jgi:hypothetical protein
MARHHRRRFRIRRSMGGTWSRHSRRTVPIRRSAWPFCQGDPGETGWSRIPIARSRCVNTCLYAAIIVPNQIGRRRYPRE